MRNRGDYHDIRAFMRDVVDDTRGLVAKEKTVALESIRHIGLIEQYNIPANFCLTREQFAEQKLGLSPGQYFKRAQVARLATVHPEIWQLMEKGKLSAAVAVLLAGKMTCANKKLILEHVPGMTKREAEGFLSRITADGELIDREAEVEIRLTLKQSEAQLLERAREVLAAGGHVPTEAEILVKAVQDLLHKRDPVEKAKRSAARRKKKVKAQAAGETHTTEFSPGKEESAAGEPCVEPPSPTALSPGKEPTPTEYREPKAETPSDGQTTSFSPGERQSIGESKAQSDPSRCAAPSEIAGRKSMHVGLCEWRTVPGTDDAGV